MTSPAQRSLPLALLGLALLAGSRESAAFPANPDQDGAGQQPAAVAGADPHEPAGPTAAGGAEAPAAQGASPDEGPGRRGDPSAVAGPDGRRGGFRLADADSPYLREHADNAVTWFPWGDEAFALARALDRPVFLSIGYSACHWCHVMEHESFEHQQTADLLDGYFVSIKVDREQRPDVDARYMRAVQAMSGTGGWPLTAFLTPEGEPFYGGTYFPLESQGGLPAFLDVLMNIENAWRLHRDELMASVEANQPVLAADVMPPPGEDPGLPGLRSAADLLARALDPVMGGYGGGAQKFPPHQALSFVLRRMARGQPLDPAGVVATLDVMASRGLRDHVGGGFHRYCVDPGWLVPHFEKMLYDNAQLAEVYALAAVVLDQPRHGDVARDLLRWLRTDMRSPEGLYHAARDADSLPFDAASRPLPGARREEGWVTTWTPDEVRAVLGPADGDAFCRLYDITEAGNFEGGRSIPRPMLTEPELAADPGQGLPRGAAFVAWNRGVLAMLREARAARPQAFRDEKLLTGWNGLALSGFAAAARHLGDAALAAETRSLGNALVGLMLHRDEGGALRLWHQRFEGRPSGDGDLADHAYLARGLLDAYGATGEPLFLATAWELGWAMVARFGDEERGGLFAYAGHDPRLPGTDRQLQDGARPAAQGVALTVLSRLAPLDDSGRLRAFVDGAMASLAPLVPVNPRAFTSLGLAVDHHLAPVAEVVLRGTPGDPSYDALLAEARGTVLSAELLIADAAAAAEALAAVGVEATPSLLEGRTDDGPATAWLCTFGVCQEPATTPEQLAAQWDVVRVP